RDLQPFLFAWESSDLVEWHLRMAVIYRNLRQSIHFQSICISDDVADLMAYWHYKTLCQYEPGQDVFARAAQLMRHSLAYPRQDPMDMWYVRKYDFFHAKSFMNPEDEHPCLASCRSAIAVTPFQPIYCVPGVTVNIEPSHSNNDDIASDISSKLQALKGKPAT